MIDDILERTDISELISFLTCVLNVKINRIEKEIDHNEVSVEKIEKGMRCEKLPEWFPEYQKFLQDIYGVYDDEIQCKAGQAGSAFASL